MEFYVNRSQLIATANSAVEHLNAVISFAATDDHSQGRLSTGRRDQQSPN